MANKTIFITGASRGVGLAIAKKFASHGYNIAMVAKTTDPHPKLPGTIWSAVDEIKTVAAKSVEVLAIPCDVRDLASLKSAVTTAGEHFGKLDGLINASSIYLVKSSDLEDKKFNLMHEVIVRSSFFASQYALPYLKKGDSSRILNIAPYPDLDPKWFDQHTAYTMFKYCSGMMVMGLAREFASSGVAVNGLWPATLLDTAAVQNLLGGEEMVKKSRKPSIMGDAAYHIFQKPVSITGNYYLDEDIILEEGLDLNGYSVVPGSQLVPDFYVKRK
jgi:citronellol/citronellal dehydrogenase